MTIIEKFLEHYSKEVDYYSNLSRLVEEKIRKELKNQGIKAIITSRSKDIDSLKRKLEKRNVDKNYKTIEDIYLDIVDLSGVRISLFFPSDKDKIEKIVSNMFYIEEKKEFKSSKPIPNFEKRFSGYCAMHYRIRLKDKDLDDRYKKSIVEIQLASVLMLAWSEIEHDLVYKPVKGGLSIAELSILDELNGLVLAGEIALERLKVAIGERVEKENYFNDNYELSNYITKRIDNNKIDIGNTKDLLYLLNASKIKQIDKINKLIKNNLIIDNNYPIADQIIDDLLINKYKDEELYNIMREYINKKTNYNYKNGFEIFLKSWILLEKVLKVLGDQEGKNINIFSNDLKDLYKIDQKSFSIIVYSRKVRNELIHGIEPYEDKKLLDLANEIKATINQLIKYVKDNNVMIKFENELNSLK